MAHANQIDPLLIVVFPFADRLDGKRIASRGGGLVEGHAMLAPNGGSFLRAPLEIIACHEIRFTRRIVNGS